jgi:hypothetical protein
VAVHPLRVGPPAPRPTKVTFCVRGVISPILANIYLHELDEFLAEMKARFDRGKHRQVHMPYQYLSSTICEGRHLIDQLLAAGRRAEAEAEKEKVRELQAKRSTMPARNWFDPKFRRLLFCRYATTSSSA